MLAICKYAIELFTVGGCPELRSGSEWLEQKFIARIASTFCPVSHDDEMHKQKNGLGSRTFTYKAKMNLLKWFVPNFENPTPRLGKISGKRFVKANSDRL